jgi:hypothetical protein
MLKELSEDLVEEPLARYDQITCTERAANAKPVGENLKP